MNLKQKLLVSVFSGIPLFSLYMPKATPLYCLALTGGMLLPPRNELAPPHTTNVMLSILVLGALMASSIWGINPTYAKQLIPGIAGLLALFGLMYSLINAQPPNTLPNNALYGFKISLIASLAVVAIDFTLDGAIWDILKSSRFEFTSYNKPLIIGCVISSAFISHYRYPTESNLNIKGWLVALWFAILLVAAFKSESDATKLALTIAILGLLLENRIPRFYGLLRYGFWTYALTLPLIFSTFLTKSYFTWFESAFDHSTLHRLYSWQHFNQFVWQKPIFGWGVGATFVSPLKSQVVLHPNTPSELTLETSTYAHNLIQQVWLEAGILGIILLIITATRTLSKIQQSPLFIRKNLLFLWMFTIVLMSFGVSIWHHWYWCSVVIAVTLSMLSSSDKQITRMHDS